MVTAMCTQGERRTNVDVVCIIIIIIIYEPCKFMIISFHNFSFLVKIIHSTVDKKLITINIEYLLFNCFNWDCSQ